VHLKSTRSPRLCGTRLPARYSGTRPATRVGARHRPVDNPRTARDCRDTAIMRSCHDAAGPGTLTHSRCPRGTRDHPGGQAAGARKTIDESGSLTLLSLTAGGRSALDAYRTALRDLLGGP
jgi:hypothetical protein